MRLLTAVVLYVLLERHPPRRQRLYIEDHLEGGRGVYLYARPGLYMLRTWGHAACTATPHHQQDGVSRQRFFFAPYRHLLHSTGAPLQIHRWELPQRVLHH